MPDLCHNLIRLIGSYLDIKSLVSWRLTHRQNFLDVEATVQELMERHELDVPHQLAVTPITPTPSRYIALNPWQSSIWFHFMVHYYKCRQCATYESCPDYNFLFPSEAEQNLLCVPCFIGMLRLVPCSLCLVYCSVEAGTNCYECHHFLCASCQRDELRRCMGCSNSFCKSCSVDGSRGNWCHLCQ